MRYKPSTSLLALVIATSIALAGCASAGNAAPAPQPTRTPQFASLEGRFSFDRIGAFLSAVEPMVAQFFETPLPDLPDPGSIVFVPRGRASSSPCGYHDSEAYEYCPAGQSIYIGQDLLWAFYRMGDAGPVVALAHEWGHHLQALRRVTPPRTPAQSVNYENQADCIAGAWTNYAGAQGWLELPDDLDDVGGLLRAIGSRETSRRDHGTGAERANAFHLGYRDGVKGCNSFSPGTPPVG